MTTSGARPRTWPYEFEQLFEAIDNTGIEATIAAIDREPPSTERDLLREALVLSANALADDPLQLAAQIFGRINVGRFPQLQSLLEGASAWREYRWLRPETRDLIEVGSDIKLHLFRHRDGVRSLMAGPSGALLISTSDDKTAWIWNLSTGTALHRLTLHRGAVITGLLTHDERRALTIGQDHVLYVWDPTSGTRVGSLAGVACWRNSAALIDGSRKAIVGTINGPLIIIDTETGNVDRSISGHRGEVTALLASADGRRILSCAQDGTIRIWDSESGDELARIRTGNTQIVRAALSDDGARLVTGALDRSVNVWDAATGSRLHTLDGHTKVTTALVVTDDGRLAISAGQQSDRAIRIWDLDTGTQVAAIDSVGSTTQAMVLLTDGRLATGSDDGVTRVWSLPHGNLIRVFDGGQRAIRSLSVTGDGNHIIAGDDDGRIIVWRQPPSMSIHGNVTDAVSLNRASLSKDAWRRPRATGAHARSALMVAAPNQELLIYSSGGESVTGWSTSQYQLRWHIDQLPASMTALAFDARSGHVLWGDTAGAMTVANASSGEIVSDWRAHSDRIVSIALDDDQRLGLIASRNGNITVFDLDTIETIVDLVPDELPTTATLVPGAAKLATGSPDGEVLIWDAMTGDLLHRLRGHEKPVRSIQASHDGRIIVTGSNDGTINGWDQRTAAHRFRIDAVAGSTANYIRPSYLVVPNTMHMIYPIQGGRIGLWSLKDNRLVQRAWHDGISPTAFAASPNGTMFLSLADDHTIRLWDVESMTLIAAITIDNRPTRCAVTNDGVVAAGIVSGKVSLFRMM